MKKYGVVGLIGGMIVLGGLGPVGAEESALTLRTTDQENGLTVVVEVDLAQLKYENREGQGLLTLPGCRTSSAKGDYPLPSYATQVVLPSSAKWVRNEVTFAIRPYPAGQFPLTRMTFACETAAGVQEGGAHAPEPLTTGSPYFHHGIQIMPIDLFPVQYDPIAKTLIGIASVTLRVTWAPNALAGHIVRPGKDHKEAARIRERLKTKALNGIKLDEWEPVQGVSRAPAMGTPSTPTFVPRTPTGSMEGVIICPENLIGWYRPIADDKTREGRPWEVVTYEWIEVQPAYADGTYQPATYTDRAARIRAFLTECYQRYGLEFVLFGGDGPPDIRCGVDRADWGGGWNTYDNNNWADAMESHKILPTRSFGYYTNLDGGHHTDLPLYGLAKKWWVTLRNPVESPGEACLTLRYEEIPVDTVIPGLNRCAYLSFHIPGRLAEVVPAGAAGSFPLGYWWDRQFFPGTGISSAFPQGLTPELKEWFGRNYPQFWNQERLFKSIGDYARDTSTCDLGRELTAGWLPVHPQMGPVSVGFYRDKVRNYRRIWIPPYSNAAAGFPSIHEQEAAMFLWGADYTGDGTGMCPTYVPPLWSFDAAFFDRTPPSGILVSGGCNFVSSYWGGSGSTSVYWNNLYARWVLHPEGGPCVGVHEGLGLQFGGAHEAMGAVDRSISASLSARDIKRSLAQQALDLDLGLDWDDLREARTYTGWKTGHQTVVVGDPSLKSRMIHLTSLAVEVPSSALPAFGLTLKKSDGSPEVGRLIAVSKRKPDGTYAYYSRQWTNVQGVAWFEPGELTALGSGVLVVEIDNYPGTRRLPLPVNAPPVVSLNLPTMIPVTTPEGTWLVMDAGASYDPDGDPIEVTWTWWDNRTGVVQTREVVGRYARAFLPVGVQVVTATVSDGHLSAIRTATIQTVDTGQLIVDHPAQASQAFTLSVRDGHGRMVEGARVKITKRLPDGTYSVSLALTTDVNGAARVGLPMAPQTLGKGVLALEVTLSGMRGWAGGMILPEGNTVPSVGYSLFHGSGSTPLRSHEFPVRKSYNGQVSPGGVRVVAWIWDPDGDALRGEWRWEQANWDTRGTKLRRVSFPQGNSAEMTGRFWEGPATVTLEVTDGLTPIQALIPLTGRKGLDYSPPTNRWGWSWLAGDFVEVTPVGGWVRIPVSLNPAYAKSHFVVIAQDPLHDWWELGPIPPGVASWEVSGIAPGVSGTDARVVDARTVEVLALPSTDGTVPSFMLSLTVSDFSGNIGSLRGEIRLVDRYPPDFRARAELTLAPASGWTAVPLRAVMPGTARWAGALEWEGWDSEPFMPGLTLAVGPVEVVGVESNDPAQPQPLTWRMEGSTLWVKTEMNGDGSLRTYTVLAQVRDLAGNASVPKLNRLHVLWPNSLRYSGKVYGVAEVPGELIPEPGVLVELQTLDGRWVTRTQTGTNGTWQLYAPSLTGPGTGYHFRASKGGRDFRYHLESLTLGNGTLLPESWTTGPAGLTLAYKNTLDWDDRLTVSVARLVTNRPPIARVAHPTLEVVSSTSSTLVTLDGRLSSDPDRDLLQGYWFWSNNPERLSYSYPGLLTQGPFPQGVTEVELWVSDGTAESRTRFYVWVHPSVDPTGASGGEGNE